MAGRQAATPVRISCSICCFSYKGLVTFTFHSSSGKNWFSYFIVPARQPAEYFHFLLLGSALCLIRSFRTLTGNRIVSSSRKRRGSAAPPGVQWHPLVFPPLSCGCQTTAFRVIPFFRRSSIAPAANAVLLTCIPPAQQRIFCHYGIPEHSRVRSAGYCHGYPHGFSPMQAFRLLPQPKASVSQSS